MENSEELHVIPASYQIEDALELSGTKVLMKAGKKMPAVKQFLKEKNCRAVMIETAAWIRNRSISARRNPGPGKLLFTDY